MAPDSKRRKKAVRWVGLIVLVLLIVTIRLVEDIGYDVKPTDRFVVTKVIDGDTVELLGGDRVRLLSIDTPEKGELFYDEAKQLLEDLVLGKAARVEFANRRRDRYGRLLGYLYVDTLFVNKIIIDSGLGYLYLFKDTDLKRSETSRLLTAQKIALQAKIGVWSLRKKIENFYIAKDNSFRFHRPGCYSVRQLKEGRYRTFETREEGFLEGLSPCRNCKP